MHKDELRWFSNSSSHCRQDDWSTQWVWRKGRMGSLEIGRKTNIPESEHWLGFPHRSLGKAFRSQNENRSRSTRPASGKCWSWKQRSQLYYMLSNTPNPMLAESIDYRTTITNTTHTQQEITSTTSPSASTKTSQPLSSVLSSFKPLHHMTPRVCPIPANEPKLTRESAVAASSCPPGLFEGTNECWQHACRARGSKR